MSGVRKSWQALIVTVLIAAMLSVAFTAVTVSAASKHTVATVCSLNLRAKASTSSTVKTVLKSGASLTLSANSKNGWAYVKSGNTAGYVSTAYLKIPSGSDVKMTAKTTSPLILRKGKGTKYAAILTIPKGKSVTVTGNTSGDWAAVKYGSYKGYVNKDYIVISVTLPTATAKAAAATQAPTQAPTVAQKLTLSKTKASLEVKKTLSLVAKDANGKTITSGLTYASSDKKIAAVSAKGVVTAVAKGTAVITVTQTSTKLKATCKVTVTAKAAATEPPTQAPAKATVKPTQAANKASVTEKPTQAPTKAAAAQATQASAQPTQAPTAAPVAETLKLSAKSATVYKGCYYHIIATSNADVKWSSSNQKVAVVSSGGIVTALAEGSTTITAKTSTKTAACKIKVVSGTAVSLSHSAVSVNLGKTFLSRCYTSGVTWTSSDTAVATVNNGGYIYAKKIGKTVITVSTSTGAATILVTVKNSESIRFAYTSPNCAAKKEKVTLYAITDMHRTGVRFEVTVGSETRTITATSKQDGKTLVWSGTTSFTSAGTYRVVAYSQYKNKWTTCDDAVTTAFVTNSSDMKTTVCAERRASDGVINLMANFEGYISTIYDDPITGDPTVGYGRVIFCGDQFYNTMTKTEAYAYLVQTVNNEGYAAKVNNLLVSNKVKFNQQQFDALVCLVYNTGAGVLTGDTQLRKALLDCGDGSGTAEYYINGSYVRIRKGPGTNYAIIKELANNTKLTVLSTKNTAWYQVKLEDGTKGYVCSDYISKRTVGGKLDLNYVNKQELINKFCQYHHAGGGCVRGLLYRRVDEMEMFFYNDYERNYGVYHYDIQFTCANNPSFHT